MRTPEAFARTWVRQVRAAKDVHAARDVYGGPAVASAAKAASVLSSDLYFVSAGMSLVDAGARIPGYDLTVSRGAAGVPTPVRIGAASPADWWRALNSAYGTGNPFANLLRKTDGPVLIALPGTYLRMVQASLVALTPANRKRLRLITTAPAAAPSDLAAQVIAYDARLDHLEGAPQGTQSSAAQRALLHFSCLLAHHGAHVDDIEKQRRWVDAALARATVKQRPERMTQTDAQITKWILREDPARKLSQTTLLRMLRASGLACEQKRFRRIAELTEPRA